MSPSLRRLILVARLVLPVLAAAVLATPASAHGRDVCHTKACVKRVQARWDRREMHHYRTHPMPRCTWWGESGPGKPEWAWSRYRAVNPLSGAGGKFQMLPSTFWAVGGRGLPNLARPVIQERLARRVLRLQGLGAWVLC